MLFDMPADWNTWLVATRLMMHTDECSRWLEMARRHLQEIDPLLLTRREQLRARRRASQALAQQIKADAAELRWEDSGELVVPRDAISADFFCSWESIACFFIREATQYQSWEEVTKKPLNHMEEHGAE